MKHVTHSITKYTELAQRAIETDCLVTCHEILTLIGSYGSIRAEKTYIRLESFLISHFKLEKNVPSVSDSLERRRSSSPSH